MDLANGPVSEIQGVQYVSTQNIGVYGSRNLEIA